MATSASDRLKALLAAKTKPKGIQHETPQTSQQTQPSVSVVDKVEVLPKAESTQTELDPEPSCTHVVDHRKQEESTSSGSLEIIPHAKDSQIAVAEAPVLSEEQKAFFDSPIGRMMQDLEVALDSKLPSMPTILRDIHLHLQKDVDCVTILSDEQIGTIVRGLESIQGTVIVANPKTGKSAGGKRAPITASML